MDLDEENAEESSNKLEPNITVYKNPEFDKPVSKTFLHGGVNMKKFARFTFTDSGKVQYEENSSFLEPDNEYDEFIEFEKYPTKLIEKDCAYCHETIDKIPVFCPRKYIHARNVFVFLPYPFCSLACCKTWIVHSQRDVNFLHVTLANFAQYCRTFFGLPLDSIPMVQRELHPRRCLNSPFKTVEEYEKARMKISSLAHHMSVQFVNSSLSYIESINENSLSKAAERRDKRNEEIKKNYEISDLQQDNFEKRIKEAVQSIENNKNLYKKPAKLNFTDQEDNNNNSKKRKKYDNIKFDPNKKKSKKQKSSPLNVLGNNITFDIQKYVEEDHVENSSSDSDE